jgi:hypothetical protein
MKNSFLRRTPRERLLVLVFLGAAALVWLLAAGNRVHQRWREGRVVALDLAGQQLWLERKAAIEQRAARAAGSLDPARTLDATRLVGEVSAIASRAGLAIAVEPPRTQRSDQFAYHTVQVTFRRAGLDKLVQFYRELGKRAPYLALEKCTLGANRSNPAEIDATFSVFSVQADK